MKYKAGTILKNNWGYVKIVRDEGTCLVVKSDIGTTWSEEFLADPEELASFRFRPIGRLEALVVWGEKI